MNPEAVIEKFLNPHFGEKFKPRKLTALEKKLVNEVNKYVDSHFASTSRAKKYVLGLAIDFTILAQTLSKYDEQAKEFREEFTAEDLFNRYTLVEKRGEQTANTLTLKYGTKSEGIRKIEESVEKLYHELNRTDYPSAYVYNTGQWGKFKDLLAMCFRLSESGRFELCKKLIKYGFQKLPENTYFGRSLPRARIFERLIKEYPRYEQNENGGLIYQAIAHGFLAADRPHLRLIADKVRTGSARQKRFGDIDCYYGLDLEVSAEVKDQYITAKNLLDELSGFIQKVTASGILGLVFVKEIEITAKQELEKRGIAAMDQNYILETIKTWDWQKQDIALNGLLHHVAHIEQNPGAAKRILEFVKTIDSNHASLAFVAIA